MVKILNQNSKYPRAKLRKNVPASIKERDDPAINIKILGPPFLSDCASHAAHPMYKGKR